MQVSDEASDPRVEALTDYVYSMQRMEFESRDFGLEDGPLGRLGSALNELSSIIERCFREQGRLLEITERVNQGHFIGEVMEHIYATFRPIIPYSRMGFALLEDDGRVVRSKWAKSDSDTIRIHSGYAQRIEGSSLNDIIASGNPRVLNDLEAHLAENPHSHSTKLILEEGIQSSLTCPLVAMGKPVGFLFFSSTEKRTYETVHQTLFRRIASQLSIIIEKSRLYEQLYELNAELIDARNALEHQATHDGLTGLWNRKAIEELLEMELARSRRDKRSAMAIMIDIDNFKQINDTLGHQTGDVVLREVARRLEEVARRGDTVGRYGGEEFLVVLSLDTLHDAENAAERYRQRICTEPIEALGRLLHVTASLGVGGSSPGAALSADALLKRADDALYSAKASGRNCVQIGFS